MIAHQTIFKKGKRVAGGAKRLTFLRLMLIVGQIRSNKPVNATLLARLNDCCEKTIQRDLEFLRDCGFPIYYDAQTFRWIWEENQPLPWWLGGPDTKAIPPSTRQHYLHEGDLRKGYAS